MKQSHTFGSLGLKQELLTAIEDAGFTEPSPVQKQAIPLILAGHDMVAQAQTGTGKTAAFCFPALSEMNRDSGIALLVMTPTRELAQQVTGEFNRFGKSMGLKAAAVYGGQSISVQLKKVREGVQAIVATPGRLLDMLRSKKLKNFCPSLVVLDEADEMLDMGFLEDIRSIFTFLPHQKQTLFFSATMPKPIRQLASQILEDPVTVKTECEKQKHEKIEQVHYCVREGERMAALIRLIDSYVPHKAIVFCRTKKEVDQLSQSLLEMGHPVRMLHGDMEQKQRQEAIHSFKQGRCRLLIATDIAGRGLDVPDISHVINYHLPMTREAHTHRIGRTGRAGKSGVAISLVTPSELRKAKRILSSGVKICAVPTLTEVRHQRHQAFLQKVKSHSTQEVSKSMYEQLAADLGPEAAGVQLMSMLLENQRMSGPENIGLLPDEIQKTPKSKRRPRRRFSKRR